MFGPLPPEADSTARENRRGARCVPRCCSVPHGAPDSARVPSLSRSAEGRCAGVGGAVASGRRGPAWCTCGEAAGVLHGAGDRAASERPSSVHGRQEGEGEPLLYPLRAAGFPNSAAHVDGVRGGVRPPLSHPPPGDGRLVSLGLLNRAEKPRFAGQQAPIQACSLRH